MLSPHSSDQLGIRLILILKMRMKVGSGNKFYYSTVIFWKKSYLIVNTLLTLASTGRWTSDEPPSLYVFINCSTRELASIEKFVVWYLNQRKVFRLFFSRSIYMWECFRILLDQYSSSFHCIVQNHCWSCCFFSFSKSVSICRKSLPHQPHHFYLILNLRHCGNLYAFLDLGWLLNYFNILFISKAVNFAVLTWVFWDFHPKICIINFFLNSFQCSTYEPENTPRYMLPICLFPVILFLVQF